MFQEHFCSIANINCSFQNDFPPTTTTTTTKLLLGPLSFARGQKAYFEIKDFFKPYGISKYYKKYGNLQKEEESSIYIPYFRADVPYYLG